MMRHRSITTVFVRNTGIVAWIWMATCTWADEFRVGILADPALNETMDSAFVDGFQLAVDQSPDVSHPPNVEGGDHLGSMDVDMVVVDRATEPDEFVTAAIDLIQRDGAAFIVADVAPDILAALFGPVTDSERMLIAMSGTSGAQFPETLFFFDAANRVGTETLLTDRSPVFADAFVSAYDRSPSAAATRGYLAGRLVDLSVEATDRDPFDERTMADALAVFGPRTPTPEEVLETITDPQERLDYVQDTLNTWLGDSNLDGQFNSTDLVQVLQQGGYEDRVVGNSTWSEGDWNGDKDFDAADFVVALQHGGFEMGPRPVVVPEPSGFCLLVLALLRIRPTISYRIPFPLPCLAQRE